MQVRAILFDTRSIQRYIFSDNRLKTNIGASYIVSHVFEDILLGKILKPGNFGLQTVNTNSWKKGEEIPDGLGADCYVAYIGGGNALVLFPDKGEDRRKEIVSAFTEELLVTYPGLKTGAALGMLQIHTPAYKESMGALYSVLKDNQNTVFPVVNVMNTGLTLSCEINGEAANAYVTSGPLVKKGDSRFFSKEAVAKIEASEGADAKLQEEFSNVLEGHKFPKELERLGQKEGENDIAVVHIDGNNMGVRFQKCDQLEDRSKLSRTVAGKTQAAFRKLLKYMIERYDSYKNFLDLKDEELPIRPLILGGDDITFICNARIALTCTKRFMEFLMDENCGGMAIDSCAGIAIVSTSYPFFRAYKLAEQLCDVAKKASRKSPGTSWLDYAILHGEQAPTIEQIREQEYRGAMGDMHFGPYRIDGETDFHFHIDKLFEAADGLKEELPSGKYKELRYVLQRGDHDMKRYMEQIQHNGYKFPSVKGWEKYAETLWDNTSGIYRTPYVDAVEIIDYVPPKEAR